MNRREVAGWIGRLLPVDTFVPEDASRWRPLVRDALQFVFTHLDRESLETKIAEQMTMPLDTPAETRLLRLISKMPGLQKVGQVLARNRRLSPNLRKALAELENGISDVTAADMRALIEGNLGERLERYSVRIDAGILSEASVSAVLRFSWCQAEREREEGVFKVLKPHIPACFAKDMRLLQRLVEYLTGKGRKYGFALQEVSQTLEEVRLLLQHELDFEREQATLGEAARMYRSSFGIRVPRLIPQLCAPGITAMSAENGVKVTEAFRGSAIRRQRIAQQIVEALIAVPFFSWTADAVFHADPHAGNLLYDEANRELIVLDWALAERLDRESRRQLAMLAMMTVLRNKDGVCAAIEALSRRDDRAEKAELIRAHVAELFGRSKKSPGVLDAMMLVDTLALEGVRFPPALFLFGKVLFTLDGVLRDVAGHDVEIDQVIVREFVVRAVASCGWFHAPFKGKDLLAIQRETLRYPWRRWA